MSTNFALRSRAFFQSCNVHQHGPYHIRVKSATGHEGPYVLDGLMHHGTGSRLDTHYMDTGGASDYVFILCAMLGFRFCPRLRDSG
jgi:TnpA family transposase